MRFLRWLLLPLLLSLATNTQATGSLISTAFQGFQTPLASDAFVRTPGTLGANWTNADTDALLIASSGVVQLTSVFNTGRAYYTGTFPANQYAQSTVVAQATAGCNSGAMALFSTAGAGVDTFYGALTNSALGGSGSIVLVKVVGGVNTTLGTYTVALAVGDTIGVSAVNGTITAYHNGTAIGSAADSAISSGSPGITISVPSGGLVTDCSLTSFVGGAINVGAATSGTTLLSYLNTLGFSKAGALFGVFLDPYLPAPLAAINTSTTTYGSLTQACGNSGGGGTGTTCGTNTGALPALVAVFAACPGNGVTGGITNLGGGGCNIEAGNTAPNDWLSLAQGAQSAGYIVNIIWSPNNPAGSGGSPWPNVLSTGNGTNSTFVGWLTQLATDLKTLSKPFILSPVGELNIPCSSAGACLTYGSYGNFGTINAQSTGVPTSSQVAQLYELILNTLVANGVPRNMFLFNYETNFGQGNNCWGWPGSGWFDIVSGDTQPATINSSGDYATLTGTGNCGHGYPFWMGSLASSGNPGSQPPNNVNTYTAVNQEMTSGTYTSMFGLALWAQGSALPFQTGATQALTTSPWLDKAALPAGGWATAKYRWSVLVPIDAGAGVAAANDEEFYPRYKRVAGWR